ncbi:MAG TPA: sodium:proton exchanger [Planctomycetes bacterium]|nr:sodium:proton exchanger [Planctomycetota bacterium]
MDESVVLYFTSVLALGVTAQWIAWRLRIPSILVLLACGIALGQVLGGSERMNELLPSGLLFPIVSLSVAVIMLEGGLTLHLKELREAGSAVFRIVTIGALVSWIGGSAAAIWILGWDPPIATLLGAILIVTGPTVVAPLLRLIRPSRKMASIVKWEGIVIDPIGAILAVIVFEVVRTAGVEGTVVLAAWSIFKTVAFGTVIAAFAGGLFVYAAQRFLIPDFLHNPIVLAFSIVVFSAANYVQPESGLVSVTILGMILANQKRVQLRHVMEFKETLQVLIIACLFILLGSRVDLSAVAELSWQGGLFIVTLIVIVRPAAVFLSMWGSNLSSRERIFLSCLAPRGIVAAAFSSVFALELSHSDGLPEPVRRQAEQLAPMTFLVILSTVAFYGLFAAPLARWLELSVRNANGLVVAGAERWVRELAKLLIDNGVTVTLIDTNYSHIAAAKMDGIPAECASVLGEYVHDEMDLSGIGRFLALTQNDEVNALAVREWTHSVGRANVFQLPAQDTQTGPRSSVNEHLFGRVLFGKELTFDEIVWRLERGYTLKATNITEEFSFEEYSTGYGGKVSVLFAVDESDQLLVQVVDNPLQIKAGCTLISLVDSQDD